MGPLPPPIPHPSSLPPPQSIAAGTRLGRYEVIAELGTGGMATVYLGRALAVAGFQRLVAIKYLHPHLLKDETFVQMFLDEGRLAARIHHPNVVGTLDLVQDVEGIYIVSEYIEGDQLLALFRAARDLNGRVPVGVTVRIMLDVLAGLHAAHEQTDDLGSPLKLVHRDVSPQNILVGSDGISRITDFGIAKAEERIASTRDGIVKGKLSYMAPEQPNDLPVDRRTDIFSAATVLWECLTGRRLFPGKTDGEVLQGLLNKPILHLREIDPEFSTAMDDVLSRALARDMDERFATAADFADALEAAATPLGIANARDVAKYVKGAAAEKLTEVKERRRAMTTRDLPVFRPSAPPAGTPSGVHAIPSRPPQTPVPSSAPPATGDEAPTQVQSSPLGAHHEAEHAKTASGSPPPLPKLPPRAAHGPLPSIRGSRPDTAASALTSAAPEAQTSEAVDPEALTRTAIPPPKELAREAVVPAPHAFVPPPPAAPAPVEKTRPSATPRATPSLALLAFIVVTVGTLLGVAIYLSTDAPPAAEAPHPPHATEPAPVAPPPAPAAVAPAPVIAPVPTPAPVPAPEIAPAPAPVIAPAPVRAAVIRPVAPRAVAQPPVAPRPVAPRPVAPRVAPTQPPSTPPPAAPPASENDLPTSI